ncbi:hypothetical protein BG006_005757 [Podila minutissima]|uniref:Uncharacterized protein n=1 Tax=Podila minutissima TaxID=64525 RepID=A0A9P5SNK0_9FUNG|nr:hypothetical protein BG006_005757 [Podila minutissima]
MFVYTLLSSLEKPWKRTKVEVPLEARSFKPRRARVHVVDYEKLHEIIRDEQGEADVYIKFPLYMKDPAVDSATLVEMAEARARQATSKSRAVREESIDTDETHESSDERDYDRDDNSGSEGVASEESATHHGSARRSSRLISKPRQSYYDGENAEMPTLKETRPAQTSKGRSKCQSGKKSTTWKDAQPLLRASKNNSKSQPSRKPTSARPQSTLAESIEELSARVRVISQLLKEEFEGFTGFKWNIRKALELKFRQGCVNAWMTYYCGQIKNTGGMLKDPSKRIGKGGRKSSVRYDCGGRLTFFINLTNQVCVMRYKHTVHPPRPEFSPAAIPDAVIEAMQKMTQEEGDLQDATGQMMYNHLVASKLIQRKQLQSLRIAFRWLQIRESRKAKNTTLSSSSTSITKAIRATNTKNKTPIKLADTSSEKDEVEDGEEEDEKAESEKEGTDKEEEADPAVDEASEYEEAIESQSQERWATPDLIEEETTSPDRAMVVDQNSEEDEYFEAEEDEDFVTEDFADQVEVDEQENTHDQEYEVPSESDDTPSMQRDIADIVERMNMRERDLADSTKTVAEIEAIEKELDLLNSFLTDMF